MFRRVGAGEPLLVNGAWYHTWKKTDGKLKSLVRRGSLFRVDLVSLTAVACAAM